MRGETVALGSRRELFVDDYLLERKSARLRLQLHSPERREIVFRTDAPWEGNACGYPSIVRTDEGWRIYYHGLHYRHSGPAAQGLAEHPANLCVIESRDGLTWTRPQVGQFTFNRSRKNNLVLLPEAVSAISGDPAHTAVFRDENPNCPPDARYKVVILGGKKHALFILKSSEGLHFTPLSTEPAITEGAFDSQNLMFWDTVRGEYREYHRFFNKGRRDILTAVSPDPARFPKPQILKYPGSPPQQLYTNQILPYYRAPHLFLGFPARYVEREWAAPLYALPGLEERLARARAHERYGSTVTDTLFMSSRDGLRFRRWDEAFIRPGPRRRGSWVYGDNYTLWGMIETPSALADAPPEISLYASEDYWEGAANSLRRYTIRLDGFVSLQAPLAGGECVTRPLVYEGGNLEINFASSAAGGVRVELQDASGQPLKGYTLEDCPEIMGDSVAQVVRWRKKGGEVRQWAGREVRLRFVLRDADLYSFRFAPYAPEPPAPDLSGLTLPPD